MQLTSDLAMSVITGESRLTHMRPESGYQPSRHYVIDQEMVDLKVEAIQNAISNIQREINKVYDELSQSVLPYNASLPAKIESVVPTIINTYVDLVACKDEQFKIVCTMIVQIQVIR